jgi:hypothetical protein
MRDCDTGKKWDRVEEERATASPGQAVDQRDEERIRATSKNTGTATMRPVNPSAQGEKRSPNTRSSVFAMERAPPERCSISPNIAPTPMTTAM